MLLIGYRPWWGFILATMATAGWTVVAIIASPWDLLVSVPLLAASGYGLNRYSQGGEIIGSRFANPVVAYGIALVAGLLGGAVALMVYPFGLLVAVTFAAGGYVAIIMGYTDGWIALTAAALSLFVIVGPLAFNDAALGPGSVLIAGACFFSYARWSKLESRISG